MGPAALRLDDRGTGLGAARRGRHRCQADRAQIRSSRSRRPFQAWPTSCAPAQRRMGSGKSGSHQNSLLEGTGFEPSVPRPRWRTCASRERGLSVGAGGTRRGVEPTGVQSNSNSISRRAPARDQVQAGRNSAASATRRNSRPPIHQIVVTCQCGIGASSHLISMMRSEVGTGSGMNTT